MTAADIAERLLEAGVGQDGAQGSEPPRRSRWRLAGVAGLTLLILVAGLLATTAASGAVRAAERDREVRELQRRVEEVRVEVEADMERYRDLAVAAAGMLTLAPDLTRAQLDRWVDDIGLAGRYPGASSLSFVEPLDEAGDEALQQRLDAGDPLVRAARDLPSGDEHFVMTASRRADHTPPALGLDYADSEEPMTALRRARDEGDTTLSATYILLRDRGLPPEQQQLSFVQATPVYDGGVVPPTVASRRALLDGWVVVSFRGADFLSQALGPAAQGLDLELDDGEAGNGDDDAREVTLLRDGAPDLDPEPLPSEGPLVARTSLSLGGRTWWLRAVPREELVAGGEATAVLTAACGTLATLVLVGAVLVAAGWRARRRDSPLAAD